VVIATFPAQTVKLRMQAGLTGPEASIWREIVEATSLDKRLRKIQSLWAGVGNKMVTSMLHAAVMFSVVELFRSVNRVFARKLLKAPM